MGWRISGEAFAAAALLAVLCGGGASWAQDETPVPRSEEFTKRVKASIQEGAEWLRSTVRPDGSCSNWRNTDLKRAAVAYHTMRVCGIPRDDPAAARAFAYVRAACETIVAKQDLELMDVAEFYSVCAALADHGEPTPSIDVAGEPSYLVSAEDKALLTTLAGYVEKSQYPDGTWALTKGLRDDGDKDVAGVFTYSALMGLKTASRCGVTVQPATWEKSLRYYLRTQDTRGETIPGEKTARGAATKQKARGWDLGSQPGSSAYYPFALDTSNALAALVICRSEIINGLKGKAAPDAKTDTAIADGFRFLGRDTFVLDRVKEGTNDFEMGFLCAIERACGLAGVERLGKSDWFGEAAEALMRHQEPSGEWCDATAKMDEAEWRRANAVDVACHALLVLAHGSRRVRWNLTAARDDSDINFAVALQLPEKDFEDFLDLVLSRWRGASDADVKSRLFTKTTAVGPRIVAPLVRRLTSAKLDERTSAFALLKHATGLEHGYAPSAPDGARAPAVAAWQSWLAANEKTLRFDAATGRIVTP